MPRARGTADRGPGSRGRARPISRRCVSRWSLFLEIGAAESEADGERPCLNWIANLGQLLQNHTLGMRGHGTGQQLLIDHIDELGVILVGRYARTILGDSHGGVHSRQERTAIHPMRLSFPVARRRRLLIEWLTEAGDELRELRGVVGLDAGGAHGTYDEFEWRLDLGADRLRRPELGGREDGAQHRPNVAAGLLPRGHCRIDAPVGWLVGHKACAQLRAHVMHRGVLAREKLEQSDAFILAVIVEGEPKDVLLAAIVSPVAENET